MHIRHPREDSEAIKYLPQNMDAIQIPEHDSCTLYSYQENFLDSITSPFKAGFYMIATIVAIAGKNVQQSLRSCGNHFLAIVAITATIGKPAYMETAQRSKSQRPLNFFGSDRSAHMETSL